MNDHRIPSDEQLVAYLDDQLDTEQRSRIDAAIAEDSLLNLRLQWLARSSLPFKEAYDQAGRQAPVERLQSMLDSLPSPERPAMDRRRFLAAAAALVVSGVVADRLFIGWQRGQQQNDWRVLMADYMALYVPQTLDHLPGDEAAQRAQLRTIDARLGNRGLAAAGRPRGARLADARAVHRLGRRGVRREPHRSARGAPAGPGASHHRVRSGRAGQRRCCPDRVPSHERTGSLRQSRVADGLPAGSNSRRIMQRRGRRGSSHRVAGTRPARNRDLQEFLPGTTVGCSP